MLDLVLMYIMKERANNMKTYNMYLRQCMTLAENVFKFNNLPIFITSNLDYPGLRNHFSQTRDDLDEIKSNRILERIMKMTKRVCFQE